MTEKLKPEPNGRRNELIILLAIITAVLGAIRYFAASSLTGNIGWGFTAVLIVVGCSFVFLSFIAVVQHRHRCRVLDILQKADAEERYVLMVIADADGSEFPQKGRFRPLVGARGFVRSIVRMDGDGGRFKLRDVIDVGYA